MEVNNDTVQSVWEKARATNDKDPGEWRKDECGAWIKRDHYGNQGSDFGWKIEPITAGEQQPLENLRPYQHENSFVLDIDKSRCLVTADRKGMPPTASIDTPRNKSAG